MTQPQQKTGPSASPSTARRVVKLVDEAIADAWPFIDDLVERACAYAQGMRPIDVLEQCLAGKHHLWIVMAGADADGIFLTTLRHHAAGLVGELWLAAAHPGRLSYGEMRLCVSLFEQWARQEGAVRAEIHGRAGWGRLFSDYGEAYRVFSKDLR